jgi:hypothetical protein
MKRLAVGLLIGFITLLILQPVSLTVNSLLNNQPTRADIWPIPPVPPPDPPPAPIPTVVAA